MKPADDPELMLHLYDDDRPGFVVCGRQLAPPRVVKDAEGKPKRRRVTNVTFVAANATCPACRGDT